MKTKSVVALLSGIGIACAGAEDRDVSPAKFVMAEPVVTLGADESLGPDYLFGSVSSVALDHRGRIYVADRSDSRVRVYDPDGALVRSLGREGQGPGEFQTPLDLTFSSEGDLWVRDLNRIQQFTARSTGEIPDSVVRTQPLSGYANTRPQRGSVRDSLYFSPGYFFPLAGGAEFFYEVFGPSGVADTIAVPDLPGMQRLRGSSYRVGRLDRSERRIVASLALAPFEALPTWQITSNGTLLVASGSDAVIRELDASHVVLREFDLPLERTAVPASLRSDSLEALRQRLDALSVRLDDVENVSEFVKQREIPDSLPTVRGLSETIDGRIWVEVWPAEPEATDFVVLDRDGGTVAHVRVPTSLAATPAYFRDNRIAGVATDRVTGVERVVVFTANR